MKPDHIGKTYGRLTIIDEMPCLKDYARMMLVKCSCSKQTVKVVRLRSLLSGATIGCGCVHREAVQASNSTHKLSKHRLYKTWLNMIERCTNPEDKNYANYGGRGIVICDEWMKVENFISDMYPTWQEKLTLDRIDNSLGYFFENCRWASKTQQNRNKRTNVNATIGGKTQCLMGWCKELNINYNTVKTRIQKGADASQAILQSANSKEKARQWGF
jgi:hypothetical protein